MSSQDLTDLLADELVSYTLEFMNNADIVRFASLSKRLRHLARDAERYVFPVSLNTSIMRIHSFKSDCRRFAKRLESLNSAGLPINVSISIDSYAYPAPNDSESEPDSDQQDSALNQLDGAAHSITPQTAHPWTRVATAIWESMIAGSLVAFELTLPLTEFVSIESGLSLPAPRLRSFILQPYDQTSPINLPHDLFAGHAPHLRSVVIGPLVRLPQPKLTCAIFSDVTTVSVTLGPLLEGLEDIGAHFPATQRLVLTPDIMRRGTSPALLYDAGLKVEANRAVYTLPRPLRHISLRLESREAFAGQYDSLAQKLYVAIYAHHIAADGAGPPIRLLLHRAEMLLRHCVPIFVTSFLGPCEPLAATLEPPIDGRYVGADCSIALYPHRNDLQARMEVVLGASSWGVTADRIFCVTFTADWLQKKMLCNLLQLPNLRTVRVILASYHDLQLPEDVGAFLMGAPVLQVVLVMLDSLRRVVPSAYMESIANRLRALTMRPTQLELEIDCTEA